MAKRRGRKAKIRWAPRTEGHRAVRINFRAPPQIQSALERAAKHNHWTVSAEVTNRLAESFALPVLPTQAVMAIVADAIDQISRLGNDKRTWLTDPTFYREAHAAAEAAFDLLKPPGEPVTREQAGIPSGRVVFEDNWNEVRCHDPKAPIDITRPRRAERQRRLTRWRKALGTLPDRVLLWGLTGPEARRRTREIAPLAEIARLLHLRHRKGLTPDQLEHLRTLYEAAPAAVKARVGVIDYSQAGPFTEI